MIAAAAGGGCDWQFSEGLHGESVISQVTNSNAYIVPQGKRLYLLSINPSDPTINGRQINSSLSTSGKPFILNSGDSLTASDPSGFSGILVNETNNLSAISIEITDLIPYTVPNGKKLVILNFEGGKFSFRRTTIFFYGSLFTRATFII